MKCQIVNHQAIFRMYLNHILISLNLGLAHRAYSLVSVGLPIVPYNRLSEKGSFDLFYFLMHPVSRFLASQ